MQRVNLYRQTSTSLAALSDEQLKRTLAHEKPMHEGIGGKSALIHVGEIPIFVKKSAID